jgi:hypothetical protein
LTAHAEAAQPEAPAAAGEPVQQTSPAPQTERQQTSSEPAPVLEQQGQDGTAVAPVSEQQEVPSPIIPQAAPLATLPTITGTPGDAPLTTTQTGTGAPANENSIFDTLHGGVTHGFLSTATWLDSFFGDERYESEINRSQFKVRFDAFRESGNNVQFLRPNFDLRLVLPQMRKKTRLVISGDPNVDVETTPSQPGGPGTSLAKPPERNLTTSLQYVPVETKRSNFSIRAGLKLHQGHLSVLAGPRYRYLIPLDPWDLRFTQEFIWSTDKRWQSRTRFDLERSLPRALFFRTSLEGIWSENVAGYPYALSLLLRQPLDRNRALEYEWINSFQTSPADELVEELLVLRYRQRFWRDWLFLEIAPQYRFPRDKSFEAQPGILFRIEMVFGDIRSIF